MMENTAKGGDDEACNCAVQPYDTMPTMLELQQMKNRLNVAQAGKELMRWNSGNTGVELKKISKELQAVYKDFGRDMRQAFMLLARCRYFNQDFYRNVIEGVKTASVNVHCTCTTVAGVKLLSFTPLEIPNGKVCKCPFLCRGGQTIQEAKKAWSNLLMSHIKMAELRSNYQAIETAYRGSLKRLNVISQIVLPKTQATINFIIDQLEENNREESNRIRVKSSKLRNCSNISYICPGSNFTYFKPIQEKQEEKNNEDSIADITSFCEILPPSESLHELQSEAIKLQNPNSIHHSFHQPTSKDASQVIDIHETMSEQRSRHKIDSLTHFYKYVSSGTEPLFMKVSKQRMSLGDFDAKMNLPKVDKATYAMDGLLQACKLTRNRLSTFASNEKPCQVDSKLTIPLGQLKSHIDGVIRANSRLQSSAFISKSVKHFIKSCEEINENLKNAIKDIDTTPLDKKSKKRIQQLISSIDDVVKIIMDYRNEGLLTPSLEEFSKVCTETKARIGFYDNKRDLQKIDYLKSFVNNIEAITSDITRDCVRTASIQNFLSSCKGFREKLEEHKRRKKQPIGDKVIVSINQKQEAPTDTDSLTESVRQFISSCDKLLREVQANVSSTKIMNSLHSNIVLNIAKMMTNLQNQGLLSKKSAAYLMSKNKSFKIDASYDENKDADLCSCQSDSCERFSQLYNFWPGTCKTNSQKYSMAGKKDIPKDVRVKENEIKVKDNAPKMEAKEFHIEGNVGAVEILEVTVKEYVSKIKDIVSSVLESIVSAEEKAEVDHSKPTQFPSSSIEGDDERTCSFELSEVSKYTICSDSSCMQSDIIVAEINTYDRCALFEEDSNTWDSKSSDSWTKPLLPRENYCAMCSSEFSSESLDKLVCEKCEKLHDIKEINRAIAKNYTFWG